MHFHEAKQVAASLARKRPRITYFPHRYAAWLLGRRVGDGASVHEINHYRLKPVVWGSAKSRRASG